VAGKKCTVNIGISVYDQEHLTSSRTGWAVKDQSTIPDVCRFLLLVITPSQTVRLI